MSNEQMMISGHWVACSPEWIKAGGDCAAAPRILCGHGQGVSHMHPAHPGDAIGTLHRSEATEHGRIILKPIGHPHIEDGMQVYTNADPGEVERLTEQLEVASQAIAHAARQAEEKQKVTDALMADAKQFRAERDTLRAQLSELEALHGGELGLPKEGWPAYHKRKMESLRDLTAGHYQRKLAERDALLREWLESHRRQQQPVTLHERTEAALSASAEPSATVERDERALFESVYPGLAARVRWSEEGQEYRSGSGGLGWQDGLKATEWLAVWKARAALDRR